MKNETMNAMQQWIRIEQERQFWISQKRRLELNWLKKIEGNG